MKGAIIVMFQFTQTIETRIELQTKIRKVLAQKYMENNCYENFHQDVSK